MYLQVKTGKNERKNVRYWALSKGVHELILSRLPTAEHTVVSTLSHFMRFLCIFALFLFYFI